MDASGGQASQGNLITVKNTFVDVQLHDDHLPESLRPPDLIRASTAPPLTGSLRRETPRRDSQAGWVDRLWEDMHPETLRENSLPGGSPRRGRSAPSVMPATKVSSRSSSSSAEARDDHSQIQAPAPKAPTSGARGQLPWTPQAAASAGQAILAQITQGSARQPQPPPTSAMPLSRADGHSHQGGSQTWSQTQSAGTAAWPATEARKKSSSAAVATLPQPQSLLVDEPKRGVYRMVWTVDARKLKGNDKQAVSPPFEMPFKIQGSSGVRQNVTFKLMICPCSVAESASAGPRGRLDQSFKRSNGTGIIQLKCEGDVEQLDAQVMFRFWIGRGDEQHSEPRGPEHHDFAKSAICGYKRQDVWDFLKVQDSASMTFNVCAEVAPPLH